MRTPIGHDDVVGRDGQTVAPQPLDNVVTKALIARDWSILQGGIAPVVEHPAGRRRQVGNRERARVREAVGQRNNVLG